MIIAFAGKMKAGKDATTEQLQSFFGGDTLPLAREVKEIAARVWGVREKNELTRELWQYVGDTLRAFDEYAWLRAWRRSLSRIYALDLFESQSEHLWVPDVRYLNELHWFQSLGGIVIRLEVTPEEQRERGAQMQFAGHISETQLDGCKWFDLVVPAGLSLDQVRERVWRYLAHDRSLRPGSDSDYARDPEAVGELLHLPVRG